MKFEEEDRFAWEEVYNHSVFKEAMRKRKSGREQAREEEVVSANRVQEKNSNNGGVIS